MGEEKIMMMGLGKGVGQKKKRYRKYTPWTLPRTRKDIFWKGSGELVCGREGDGGLGRYSFGHSCFN